MTSATLIAVCLLVAAQPQQDTLPSELRAARTALDAGNVEQAIELAEGYMWRHKRDPRGYLMVGDAYAARLPAGRFRAIRAYQQAERLDRDNPAPSYRIAQLGLALGGADGERLAADGLGRVLELDPLYESAWAQWLTVFRNSGGRRKMLERLAPFRDHAEVRARMALLLMEEERYAEANRFLDSALVTDSSNMAWLALRAQSAFEAGDTLNGVAFYRRALSNASQDSTDALWRQVVGIATPEEILAWGVGVPPEQKAGWLRSFWARRNPNLFAGINDRIAEHFERWRYARREYPLLHPLVTYQRDAEGRALNLEPSQGERMFHLRCEVFEVPQPSPLSAADPSRAEPLSFDPGPGRIQSRPLISAQDESRRFLYLTDEAKESIKRKYRLARLRPPEAVEQALNWTPFAPLNFDLRSVDTTAARVGYNLATGLSDRGLAYLRLGPPEHMVLGGDNSMDPECNTTELVRWRYDLWGELRFAKPVAFSEGRRTLSEMVFRPMELPQFEAMEIALTRDAPTEPAPLEFGVWTAALRNPSQPNLSDLVVVSSRGALAATLVGVAGGEGQVHEDSAGVVVLTAPPGDYTLLAHAQEESELGRLRVSHELQGFDSLPAISDLLVADPWTADVIDRSGMLSHVDRDLTFVSGDTVRAYAEVYGLSTEAQSIRYQATYLLLKTGNVERDYAKEEWPDAVRFEFDRQQSVSDSDMVAEVLDITPQWIPKGTYLLRLEVHDQVADRSAGRATIAFEVGR